MAKKHDGHHRERAVQLVELEASDTFSSDAIGHESAEGHHGGKEDEGDQAGGPRGVPEIGRGEGDHAAATSSGQPPT